MKIKIKKNEKYINIIFDLIILLYYLKFVYFLLKKNKIYI